MLIRHVLPANVSLDKYEKSYHFHLMVGAINFHLSSAMKPQVLQYLAY